MGGWEKFAPLWPMTLISPKDFGHPQRLFGLNFQTLHRHLLCSAFGKAQEKRLGTSHVTAGAFHGLKIGMLTNGTQRIDIGTTYTAHLYEALNLTGSTCTRQGGDNRDPGQHVFDWYMEAIFRWRYSKRSPELLGLQYRGPEVPTDLDQGTGDEKRAGPVMWNQRMKLVLVTRVM